MPHGLTEATLTVNNMLIVIACSGVSTGGDGVNASVPEFGEEGTPMYLPPSPPRYHSTIVDIPFKDIELQNILLLLMTLGLFKVYM
jgi:hypothetical protein